MMRLNVFLSFILMLTATSIAAQETGDELWNWAWRNTTGELFAYSSSGKIHTLLAEGVARSYDVWRLGRDDAIGLLEIADQAVFYRLSARTAQPLHATFDLQSLRDPFQSRYGYRLEAYHAPYVVFTPITAQDSSGLASAVLINLDTNQIELVSNNIRQIYGCCRFTEDGTRLRYIVGRSRNEMQPLEVRERIVATGEEHLLFTFDGFADADQYGERWLLNEWDADTNLSIFRLLTVDDLQSKVLVSADTPPYPSYEFVGDDLISYLPVCEVNCVLEILTAKGETYTYDLPPAPGGSSVYYGSRFSADTVFIGRLQDYWFLSRSGAPRFMGYNYPGGSHLPSELSPDRHWVLASETPDYPALEPTIWDLTTQSPVLTVDIKMGDSLSMVWDREGFIANGMDTGAGVMYRYDNQQAFDLPAFAYGEYFDILPDGSVLYETPGSKTREAGIYRYQPEKEELTVLLENVRRIPLMEIDYDYHP